VNEMFNGLTIADFHGDIHRNIVSLRVSENLYDDLSDGPDGWKAATDLEMASKPINYTSSQPIIARPFEESDHNSAIEYPFRHWASTRYSNGEFGVWYGSDTIETSIYETVHHWRDKLLKDADWQDVDGIQIQRKVYLVRCDAGLLDFRARIHSHPSLIDTDSYYLTRQVGARIHHDGHPSLISRSARCDGDIYAIFNQRVLSNPRHVCYLNYRIECGSVAIEREPGKPFYSA